MLHHLVDEFAKLELFVLNRCLNFQSVAKAIRGPFTGRPMNSLPNSGFFVPTLMGPAPTSQWGAHHGAHGANGANGRPLPAPPLSIGETQHRCSGAKHCCSGSISVALAALESKWPFNQGKILIYVDSF